MPRQVPVRLTRSRSEVVRALTRWNGFGELDPLALRILDFYPTRALVRKTPSDSSTNAVVAPHEITEQSS